MKYKTLTAEEIEARRKNIRQLKPALPVKLF